MSRQYQGVNVAVGRLISLSCMILGLAGLPSMADDEASPTANVGDTPEAVVTKFGKPQGSITRGGVTTYYYDRGMVDFVDGRVKTAFLVTPEEASQQREAREKAEADRRRQAETARLQLIDEGARELARLREDKALAKRAGADRAAFWREFTRRYPHTDVSAELAQAEADTAVDSQRRKQEEELRTLNDRVAAIQARFAKLDADYAASLTHWKRNEINAERARLEAEKKDLLTRMQGLHPADTK